MLIDTGPLVSLMDTGAPNHSACLAVIRVLPPGPLLTTWPCFTEAMYLLDGLGGHRLQDRLWKVRIEGKLILLDISKEEADRMQELTAQYQDRPMDMADASLMAVAERRKLKRIFTTDSDFYFYKLLDGTDLEVIR